MMFEKQCKSGIDVDKLKASSSALENPSALSSDAIQDSPAKNEMEASLVDCGKTETNTINANSALEGSLQELSGKQKASQTEAPGNSESDNCESSSQPAKRPRTDA